MRLDEYPVSLAQLVGLTPVTKMPEDRDCRQGPAQVMVFTGPELTDTMDWAIQATVERLFQEFHIGVREITGVPNLFIEQLPGGIIIYEGGLQPTGRWWDARFRSPAPDY